MGADRPEAGRSCRVVVGLATRRSLRSAAWWGVGFGVLVASSATSYTSFYRTAAQRAGLATEFAGDHAVTALFGPDPDLQTVAGFTAFKVTMLVAVLSALWGLLTATRLLRGEEDAGRWDLVAAGPDTPRALTGSTLVGLGAGVTVLWAATALLGAAAGATHAVHLGAASCAYLALALVTPAALFASVGAVASQLWPTRRQAVAASSVVLGISYLVRMVADAGVGVAWLRWASPLGWVEELRPLTSPDPVALVAPAVTAAALVVLAVHLAGRRDLGAGILPDRSHRTARLRLLGGAGGLALRLVRPVALGWLTGLVALGLVFGLVARAAGRSLAGSTGRLLARLGATGGGTAAYLGVTFLIVAVAVAFLAAGQLSAARDEETSGRLDHLLVRPVGRTSWLVGRWALAVALSLVGGVAAGLAAWSGAATQGRPPGLGSLLAAGSATAAPAVLVLGVGVAAFGCWPRGAVRVTYALLAWSAAIEVVGSTGGIDHRVLDTSVFHHLAAAPAVPPDWGTVAVMVGLGALGAAVGSVAFGRRDLRSA